MKPNLYLRILFPFLAFSHYSFSVNPATAAGVPVGVMNTYEPLSGTMGLQMVVLWAVSLTKCC